MGGQYLFVKTFMKREKYIYITYISCMYVLVFQRKPYLHLVNGFNSFKLVQNFDAHNSNQKKKKTYQF